MPNSRALPGGARSGAAIAGNANARDAVLARVRQALGKTGDRTRAATEAEAYVAARAQGPRPQMEHDLVARFMSRARDMASTVERVASRADIPHAVGRYVAQL